MKKRLDEVTQYLFGLTYIIGVPLLSLLVKNKRFNQVMEDKRLDAIRPGDFFYSGFFCGAWTVFSLVATLYVWIKTNLLFSLLFLIVAGSTFYATFPLFFHIFLFSLKTDSESDSNDRGTKTP